MVQIRKGRGGIYSKKTKLSKRRSYMHVSDEVTLNRERVWQ